MTFTNISKWVPALVMMISALLPIKPAWPAGWDLVFSDEFNGVELDRTKWATRYIYNNETMDYFTDEVQRYRDNHVLSGGRSAWLRRRWRAQTFLNPR
ncbi:hypothetical protein ACFKHW_27000 [Bradyrhizobium lupini]|uniref:hypothetical protein n=1 Tax=Rhizobium lupini TaxID=136996 RepID=UPI003670DC2E